MREGLVALTGCCCRCKVAVAGDKCSYRISGLKQDTFMYMLETFFLKGFSIMKKTSLLQLLAIFVLASCGSSNNENDVPSDPLLTLSDLTVDSVDNIFYPPFSADTRHYAASCGDGESFSVGWLV